MKKGFSRRSIRKELNKRLKAFVESIEREEIKNIIRNRTIVTGGAIASMLMGDDINDVDIYFKDQESALKVSRYFVKIATGEEPRHELSYEEGTGRGSAPDHAVGLKDQVNLKGASEKVVSIYIPSGGVIFSDSQEDYFPKCITENAITLNNDIQLITRFSGSVEEIHANFDFVHATCSYDWGSNELVLPPEALENIISRTLDYRGSLYPLASLFRLRKFIARGWTVNAGQILKIAFQIGKIDFTDSYVLQDQLTGVDQTFMNSLIRALHGVPKEQMNPEYVSVLIDKIFSSDDEIKED